MIPRSTVPQFHTLGPQSGATQSKKVIGVVSWETQRLAERLAQATPEDPFISYNTLSTICGKNVQGPGRHNLEAAREIALRDHQMLFGVIRNEGLKLLSDAERVHTGEGVKKRMRRLARKGIRQVTSVRSFDALPQDLKVQHHLYVTLFRLTDRSTRKPTIQQIEGRVRETMRALHAREVLQLFQPRKTKEEVT